MQPDPDGRGLPDDEFAALPENAAEAGIPPADLLRVRRVDAETAQGRVSALRWGGDPRLVLLHGGGQNAHTWDTVLAGLGEPALAVDLPGHGHSDWRDDRDYTPQANAATVAEALTSWGVHGVPVVGMSLGGLTGLALAARSPGLATRLVVVDVTPSVLARVTRMTTAQRGTTALVAGPAVFDSLDEMVEAAAVGAPHRPRASLRRGVAHNAHRLPDGRWAWRYDRQQADPATYEQLWDDVGSLDLPVTLVRGGDSPFVGAEDVAEFRARHARLDVRVVPGAGHSVQSDRPVELAALLREVLARG
jgi:esterase